MRDLRTFSGIKDPARKRELTLKIKRTLLKLTAAVSLFVAGLATVNAVKPADASQTVQAASKADTRDDIVKLARAQVGKGYVYGATGPYAFDCSGLVQYVFRKAADITLGRTTYQQVYSGKSVSLKNLKKGDLLFWGSASSPYHVGIYVGNGRYVHAATPGQGVIEQTISSYFYPSAAKRVL